MSSDPGAHVADGVVERVVLLDPTGNRVGVADKATVHHAATPLHLAFSCYVFDAEDRLLVTRRALHKRTWPGVWTNSACGHPGPGEDLAEAVRRRVRQELDVTLTELRLVLPAFRYEAVMADGTRENEMCPVFCAVTADPVRADPDEVAETRWVAWGRFAAEVLAGEREVSPWCREQVAQLRGRESDRGGWEPADPAQLPPAVVTSR